MLDGSSMIPRGSIEVAEIAMCHLGRVSLNSDSMSTREYAPVYSP